MSQTLKADTVKLDKIVVSEESFNSEEQYDIIHSNIDYVNALFNEYFYKNEVSDDALKSYYVDYYLAQVNNGGFSQFVYNSRWHNDTIRFVRIGLKEMGATEHLALFSRSAKILDQLGASRIDEYLDSQYFGTNEERDILNAFDDQFYELEKSESLIALNSQWLKAHKHLEVLSEEQFQQSVQSNAKLITNREKRIRDSLDAEPEYKKLIRTLSKKSGQSFERITAGSYTTYKDEQTLAWYFITDVGVHYMVEYKGQAIMIDNKSKQTVTTISTGA